MTNSVVKNKIYILLLAVVLLAAVLRFYKIDQFPVSLYWDEASSTYNAYSIAQTGKDEFGNKIPLLFKAFEDYKTPANIYLTSVAVKAFGLNEFSARFTSAFLGTLTVLVSFFLVTQLFRKKIFDFEPEYLALLTSTLVAISPWHIQFSRTGFEANCGLFFVVLGSALFISYINNSKKYAFLLISMASFAISIYFYRSIWVVTPLLLIAFFSIYHKVLFSKENIKKTIGAIILFFILVAPFVPIMISRQGMVRANQVIVVNNSQDQVLESAKKQENTGELGKVIYNRRLVYLFESGKGYINHFSPNFLFFNGDGNGRHGVNGVGVLYLWGIIFVIPGLIALTKIDRKTACVIITWLLIAPIPAAISVPAPHALRSLNMIPIPQLIVSLGILWFLFAAGKKHRLVISAFIIGMIIFFLQSYLTLYYGDNAKKTSGEWADGYKQLTSYVFQNENKYDKIIISGHYWQPYIYFLFYKKYDPELFQQKGKKSGFDKYIFGGTSWDMNGRELGDQDLRKLAGKSNYLVALSPVEYNLQKKNLVVVKEIKNHNNELVFIVAKPK